MNGREIKEAFRQGRTVVGPWVFGFNMAGIPRLLASTGIDFAIYDMEHSGFGLDSVRGLIAESRPVNLAALVRPPANEYHLIAPLLDAGAYGIIVPNIETASEAASFVDACRYFPEGHRGAAFSISHDDYLPGEVAEKMRSANEGVICGVLVETEQGIKNLDTILDVEGIDLVWVGFLDLSLSMGIPGQFSHPRFKEAERFILQVSKAHKKPVGTLSASLDQVQEHLKEGYQCIAYGGDIWLLQRALSEGVKAVRKESSLRSGS